MKKDRVITDGEKLRAIRKKYNLKQEEVAGNDITRNLLSEIETGKAAITKKTAEVIIRNLTRLSEKKKFKVTETVEYLIENQLIQATKILDNYILELKKLLISKDGSFIETLKAAKSFLANWNINKKMASIYEIAGDYYYIQNEMYESIMYYEKALTAIGKLLPSNELLQVFFKIIKAYIHVGNYDKAIESFTFVIENFDDLSEEDVFKFTYNRAYVYYLLKKYELALSDIDKIESYVNESGAEDYFLLLDTKAACFYRIGHYEEALNVYNKLLYSLDKSNLDRKLVIYVNITETYLAQCENKKATTVFKKVQNELPFLNNSTYEADIYYEVGNIYKDLSNADEAYKYYNKALNAAKEKKDYILLNTVFETMLENTNDVDIMSLIKDEVFTLITKQEKLSEKLIHKLLIFYANNNDIKSVKEISSFALKFVA